jgi:apolipoprotein N-acyltransferase
MPPTGLFGTISALRPWPARALATASGAVSILAFKPFGLWPLLWLTLPTLMILSAAAADRKSPERMSRVTPWLGRPAGRAAEIGWWFGLGFHLAGLFWIGEAFLVEAEIFAWLMPFAVTSLPAFLALFFALASASAAALSPGVSTRHALVLAIALAGVEWLRGHVLTGLPWNILGYALTNELVLMQSASVLGIYGLTLVAGIIFLLPAAAVLSAATSDRQSSRGFRLLALVCAIGPLLAMSSYGTVRLAAAPTAATDAPLVRVVQPSIRQREKWQREHQRRIFDEHITASLTRSDGTVDGASNIALLVWPEAAMPFLPLQEPVALLEIGRMLHPRTTLATGALRLEQGERGRKIFNSVLFFRGGEPAKHVATYDKVHLVPFGEYLPLQSWLEAIGLQQVVRLPGGFASGNNLRHTVEIEGIGTVATLICYEAIFPREVVDAERRPRVMVNVTNDGWFGNTTGPRQHLQQARLRAVEKGIPLIRAANNGISALVDAHGRIVASLDLDRKGSFDAALPPMVAATVYSRFGDGLFALMCLAAVVVSSFLPGQRLHSA